MSELFFYTFTIKPDLRRNTITLLVKYMVTINLCDFLRTGTSAKLVEFETNHHIKI